MKESTGGSLGDVSSQPSSASDSLGDGPQNSLTLSTSRYLHLHKEEMNAEEP